jgi:hypothetical protein
MKFPRIALSECPYTVDKSESEIIVVLLDCATMHILFCPSKKCTERYNGWPCVGSLEGYDADWIEEIE